MTGDLAWPVRPKWHRLESPRSYLRRQCAAAGIPFSAAERGLTTSTQPNVGRVWVGDDAALAIVEAGAGRPAGHCARLMELAQPNPEGRYPKRFLCRLCAAGERVEQIPHDRENWCLRHPGQMVWVGPGTMPESQPVLPFDRTQAHAERKFRRIVAADRVDPELHARVWEMVRDNAALTTSQAPTEAPRPSADDREILGRAAQYPVVVAVLEVLSNTSTIQRWRTMPTDRVRDAIAQDLPPIGVPAEVLVERILLWMRPIRRATRPTRFATMHPSLDVVNVAAIIDATAPYPLWIRRNPNAVAEWAWGLNDRTRNPWDAPDMSKNAWWICGKGHLWETSPSTRGLAKSGCPYCAGQRAWPGHTDLGTTHPDLAKEWDKTRGRNAGDPDHVSADSGRRINWRCRSGHRWAAPIRVRATTGRGCPYCAGTRVWRE
ncbi:zinc-ribbon domain-containing protein [Microbacterium luteum]|uniref:zinc-ribbon domain-containing protein n=1 Tax=Microbacterium TaxID=33882 RepID=UPI0018872390|nr:zinc-ribbon domain-containing protein [Microbacterium luteum]